ncbi:hypothetical protein [Marisediminicola sp. LYQ134]|uniref:hypothetical protein n=1 Tax=Marisediminicola sp. LYQ134 TaxID=3391061 RepID=UPI003982E956
MRRRATSIVLAATAALALSGCTFTAVQATQKVYDPSDGVGATVGSVRVLNTMLLTDDGETGNLVTSFVNTGQQNVAMSVSWEGPNGRVDRNVYIPAGTVRDLGTGGNQFLLRGIDAELGGLFPVYFQYDDSAEELRVPVLDGDRPEYADLVPTTDDDTADDDTGTAETTESE